MDKRISKRGPLNLELNKRVSPLTKKVARLTWKGDYSKRSCRRIQKMLYRIYRAPLQYGELVWIAFYMQDCAKYYENRQAKMLMIQASIEILNFARFYDYLL